MRSAVLSRVTAVLDRHAGTVPVRLLRLFLRIDGRDRVLMLAGQAFIAVIPLLIVVASFAGADGSSAVGGYLVRRFDLDGSAETSVRLLFERPPEAAGGTTLLSLVVLLWTVNSFARSLQRTFADTWSLPRRAPGVVLHRAAGLLVLLVVLSGASWAGRLTDAGVLGTVLGLVIQVGVLVGGWLVATHLLLSRRVPVADLLPGAVATAAVQLLAGWGTALWMPQLVARNADHYGVIGAALALVSWLIVIAAIIVASAVAGRVLAPVPDEQEGEPACPTPE